MILGIVGHAAEKFTKDTEASARDAIRIAVESLRPTLIVSGHSPMGGVDIWAEEVAATFHVPTRIFAPKQHTWDGEYGFKARNLDIANTSDLVLCVVVKDLPNGFRGMKFSDCYHCKGRNPRHVKSGGCWTAWKCKAHEWRVIE